MTHLSPDRLGRITSSSAAACLGLDPYTSPLEAWQRIRGDAQDEQTNAAMERGKLLEPAILDYARQQLNDGADVLDFPGFAIHPEHRWLGSTVDALAVITDELTHCVEAKSVGYGLADRWGETGTDQIPDRVLIQCHVHLMCHPKARRCMVPVLIGGYQFEFRTYWVDRSASLHDQLIDKLGSWHQRHIVDGVRPEPTAADNDWLAKMFPDATEAAVEDADTLTEIEKWAREYDETRAHLKAVDAEKKLARAKLLGLIEAHDAARGDAWSVTYRNTKDRTSTNWKAVAEDVGAPEEIIHKHTKVTPGTRSLRVTVRKEKEAKQ
jgi:putative phage-type endonuclease